MNDDEIEKEETGKDINEINNELDTLFETVEKNAELVKDLIEYLERKGVLEIDEANFEDWKYQLQKLRWEETKQKELNRAKRVLEDAGYFVVRDHGEVEAKRLRKWLDSESDN